MPKKVNGEVCGMPEMADKKKCNKYINDIYNGAEVDYDDFDDESNFSYDDLFYIANKIQDIVDNEKLTDDQFMSLCEGGIKLADIGKEWEKQYNKIMSEGQVITKKITKGGPTFN